MGTVIFVVVKINKVSFYAEERPKALYWVVRDIIAQKLRTSVRATIQNEKNKFSEYSWKMAPGDKVISECLKQHKADQLEPGNNSCENGSY